ncbi:MAG: OmpA family protein [Bacteroidales bacterium]|nr:OmpA family protein [Bacteroidales bacterium]
MAFLHEGWLRYAAMRRTILSIFLFLSVVAGLEAQNRPVNLIKRGKYEKANYHISKMLHNDTADIVACYANALLFSTADWEESHIDTAWKYIVKAYKSYYRIRDRAFLMEVYKAGINESTIKRTMRHIIREAYQQAEQLHTYAGYEHFLRHYDHPYAKPQIKRAERSLEVLFLEQNRSIEDYKAYLKENPWSPYRRRVEDSLFILACPDTSLEQLAAFLAAYPYNHNCEDALELLIQRYAADGELSSLMVLPAAYPDAIKKPLYRMELKTAMQAWQLGLTDTYPEEQQGEAGTVEENKASELKRRLQREGAMAGDLQLSLMWNNYNDIDLHCIDPLGEEIYYRNKKSERYGELDVDMNVHYMQGRSSVEPVENIYWPSGYAMPGTYKVYVRHFRKHEGENTDDPTPYTVRVLNNGKEAYYEGELVFDYYQPRIHIADITYNPPRKEINYHETAVRKRLLKYIIDAPQKELAWIAAQRYLRIFLDNGVYAKAVAAIDTLLPFFIKAPHTAGRLKTLQDILRAKHGEVKKEALSGAVNTRHDEYMPVITVDEQRIYLCSRGRGESLGGEDVFSSDYRQGQWLAPELVRGVNTAAYNEAPMAVSPDGNRMLLFRGGDLFMVTRSHHGWDTPVRLPEPVNTLSWEGDACFTADGMGIIFASDRAGGLNRTGQPLFYHGILNYASDIYISFHDGQGKWSQPQSLGDAVNTPFCERSPFLHPDMKTLYFSSDGHAGLGGLDLFMTKRVDDTCWISWATPVNMGTGINTTGDDWGYNFSAAGEYAYASMPSKYSDDDICRITVPEALRPEIVVRVFGKVFDAEDSAGVQAAIKWEALPAGRRIGIAATDPTSGDYSIMLQPGKRYGYFVEKEGYYPVSRNIDLREVYRSEEIRVDIEMVSIKTMISSGKALNINNLFFDHDKAMLRKESYAELDRLVDFLNMIPEQVVEIAGHTDNTGSAEYNKALSGARAQAVCNYLVQQGVSKSRLIVNGFGETKPIETNDTSYGREKNRRVTFRLVNTKE